MFVISCLSVLVQEGAFGTLLSAAATNSSVSLSVLLAAAFWLCFLCFYRFQRGFCGLFVLPCFSVLLSAGASFALLSGCVPFCSTARAAIGLLMLDLNSP